MPSSRYLSQHLRPTRQRPLSASKRPLCRVCKVPSFLIREPAGDAARGWKRRWPFHDARTELPYRRHGLSPTTGGLASHGLRADSHDDDDDLHQHVCLSGRPSSRTNRAGDRAVVTPVRLGSGTRWAGNFSTPARNWTLDLDSRRESFRTPTLPRFHKGNSGGELAVAAWQLTEADSGGPPQSFRGESTGEGAFSRSLQEGLRGLGYISIYQSPPPTTNTALCPPTTIRPWVRLPFRSNEAGRSVILSRRVIAAMPRPASASTAALVARRPIGRP